MDEAKSAEKKDTNFFSISFWQWLITALLTVIGWGVVNYYQGQRERNTKIRDIKIAYLIDAYRKLAYSVERPPYIMSYHRDIENAIADIQLFGSKKDIEILVQELNDVNKIPGNNTVNYRLTLTRIRNSLREEIMLDKIESNVTWIRFKPSPSFDSAMNLLLEPNNINPYR